METMERDPQYIAETLRLIRKMLGLTQENLADLANLSTRTIEKAESGRHCPQEQTLRSIARATGFDVKLFDKPTPEQKARQQAEIRRAACKQLIVPTSPIRTKREFMATFDQRHAFSFDTNAVEDDDALEVVMAIVDWLKDLNDIWDDMNMSQRLGSAESVVELFQDIESKGYLCHMGRFRQQLKEVGKPPLVFDVGLLSILPKDGTDGERFALVQVNDGWETLEEDRPAEMREGYPMA